MEPLALTGWRHSVYTRIVRMVLAEKGLDAAFRDVDPFAEPKPAGLSPFGLVPVLRHGDFTLYETAAICRYLDEAFAGPLLQPPETRARARMVQVIALADGRAYWPLVRQVYAGAVFGPAEGSPRDAEAVALGLAAAAPVLAALEQIAAEGLVLDGLRITLADLHLGAMIDAFVRAPEGRAALAAYPALARWWARISTLGSLAATDAGLPQSGADKG